jgi:hypothetical protein
MRGAIHLLLQYVIMALCLGKHRDFTFFTFTSCSIFETVTKNFKYLGTAETNHNCIHGNVDSRLNSGTACYHSVQKLLYSPHLLSKNWKIKI